MEDLLDDSGVKTRRLVVKSWILVVLLFILSFSMWGAFVLAVWKIETIIISGSVILVLGALLFILALLSKRVLTTMSALIAVFEVFLIVLVILIYDLSPSEAAGPVPFLILIFNSIESIVATAVIRMIYSTGNTDHRSSWNRRRFRHHNITIHRSKH